MFAGRQFRTKRHPDHRVEFKPAVLGGSLVLAVAGERVDGGSKERFE
jgi:hypothetical protein